jgi:hypothetical protein
MTQTVIISVPAGNYRKNISAKLQSGFMPGRSSVQITDLYVIFFSSFEHIADHEDIHLHTFQSVTHHHTTIQCYKNFATESTVTLTTIKEIKSRSRRPVTCH